MKLLKKGILILLCVDMVAVVIALCLMFLADRATKSGPETIPLPEAADAVSSVEETAESSAGAAEETQEPEAPQSTTIAFTGDILLNESVAPNYDADGVSGLLDDTLLHLLQDADITMVNEEFPFSTRGTKMADKSFTFRVDPAYVSAFQEMGVDIVSLANNHALDYGKEALSDTFETLDGAGILYAGAGETEERAAQLQTFEVNGKTFGFLAASRVIPVTGWNVKNEQPGLFCTYDDTDLLEEIRKAKEQCDFVAVFVHWGKERTTVLEEHQRDLGRNYIDAGADVVVGAHPHILQGIEYYNGKPIFYSLGNFIFNSSNEATAALQVTVSPENEVTCQLTAASSTGGKTSAMDEASAQRLYADLTSLSDNVQVDANGVVTEQDS